MTRESRTYPQELTALEGWDDMSEEEQLAAAWFRELTGLLPEPHDLPGIRDGHGRVDFLLPDAGALEVTFHMDPRWRKRNDEIWQLRIDDEGHWSAPGLRLHWTANFEEPDRYERAHPGSKPPQIVEVHRSLPDILAFFENDERFRRDNGSVHVPFEWCDHARITVNLHRADANFPEPDDWMLHLVELERLGLDGAHGYPAKGGGARIFPACGGGGGMGSSLVAQAAEDAAARKAKKFKNLHGTSHLWVWVADGKFLTSWAMDREALPTEHPNTFGIEHVWVASLNGVVWHYSTDAGWRVASRQGERTPPH